MVLREYRYFHAYMCSALYYATATTTTITTTAAATTTHTSIRKY